MSSAGEVNGLKRLRDDVIEVFGREGVVPVRGTFGFRQDGVVKCCAITAACLKGGNLEALFLGDTVSAAEAYEYGMKEYGLSEDTLDGVMEGFDFGDRGPLTLQHDGEFYAGREVGMELRARFIEGTKP
jgi:hypothetical protein